MKRGEVWWIRFDPSEGSEIKKTRPAIIVSNNLSNNALPILQVVPLTSNISKLFPNEAFIASLKKKSKALAHQLTTISKSRVEKKIGKITENELKALDKAIQLQLNLL